VAVVPISAVLSKPCRDIITLFRPTSFRFHFPISCFFFPFLFFLLLLVITIRHYDFVINLLDFLLCQLIFVCILPKHKAIAGLVKQSEIQTLQTLQIRKISKYPTLGASDQFLQDKIPSESQECHRSFRSVYLPSSSAHPRVNEACSSAHTPWSLLALYLRFDEDEF
jgi:hypothetical protein